MVFLFISKLLGLGLSGQAQAQAKAGTGAAASAVPKAKKTQPEAGQRRDAPPPAIPTEVKKDLDWKDEWYASSGESDVDLERIEFRYYANGGLRVPQHIVGHSFPAPIVSDCSDDSQVDEEEAKCQEDDPDAEPDRIYMSPEERRLILDIKYDEMQEQLRYLKFYLKKKAKGEKLEPELQSLEDKMHAGLLYTALITIYDVYKIW